MLARCQVRSGCLVHGDGESGWPRLALEVVGSSARSERRHVEGVARVIIGG